MAKFALKTIGLLVIATVALGLYVYEPWSGGADSAVPLTDLHSLEEFRELFNQDEGVPRLVLLLSPT